MAEQGTRARKVGVEIFRTAITDVTSPNVPCKSHRTGFRSEIKQTAQSVCAGPRVSGRYKIQKFPARVRSSQPVVRYDS